MSYGTPPFCSSPWPVPPGGSPDNTQTQAGPENWATATGTFVTKVTHPPYIQRGSTMRFRYLIAHVTDGPIGTPTRPFTAPLTLVILDRNRQVAQAAFFTIGTVTADPANSNSFYADVFVTTNCDLQYFEAKWAGSYTPDGSVVALPFQDVRGFKVNQPANPGKHFFFATDTYGRR